MAFFNNDFNHHHHHINNPDILVPSSSSSNNNNLPTISNHLLYGLSTDTKPTTGYSTNSLFVESDTGSVYYWSGSSWNLFTGTIGG
jgi:hypothetical protein